MIQILVSLSFVSKYFPEMLTPLKTLYNISVMVNLLTTANPNLLEQMKFQKQPLISLLLNIGLVGKGLYRSHGILKPQPLAKSSLSSFSLQDKSNDQTSHIIK